MTSETPPPFPAAVLSARGIRQLLGDERPGDPSADQTPDQVAQHYRNAKEGETAVIRETYANRLWFVVTTITGTNPKAGRLYLADAPKSGHGGRAFYAKSGKNCFSPKGQSSLVIPTEAVLEHAKRYPHQDLGEGFHIPPPARP